MSFVVADIGGTKADLAVFVRRGDTLEMIKRETYYTKDHSGIIDALKEFGVHDLDHIEGVAVGIAAPVQGRVVRLTNLDWVIDADEIVRTFDCSNVHLINDLAAHAYGVIHISDENKHTLQKGEPEAGNLALIAPGTGLGEAIVYFDGKTYHPIASEGGHASFAPINDEQTDLLRYAIKRYEHVSCERMISGSLGFRILAEYFVERDDSPKESRELLQEALTHKDVGGRVYRYSEEGDAVCKKIMSLFVSMLAAEAANLALKSMAVGGVYLCGGIPRKILPWLTTEAFTHGFTAKGRFSTLMEKIPVHIVLDDLNALRGLAHFAIKMGST